MGPSLSDLDPKLRNALSQMYESILSDLEIRWLHFQSLLFNIEKIDDETEKFLEMLFEKR